MVTKETEARNRGDTELSGPNSRPTAANDNHHETESDQLIFTVVEQPEHSNQYLWTVAARLNGQTLGTGKHHLKRSASQLAEAAARSELTKRMVTERLQKNGLFDKPSKPPPDLSRNRNPTSKRGRSSAVDRLRQTMRELSDERGKRAEDLVFQAFADAVKDAPEWFKGLRHPTEEQDAFEQIDVIVETCDLGDLYIQVKSSFTGLKRFLDEYHPKNVRCIVVTPNLDDGYIRALVYDAANRLRAKRQRGEI